MQLIKRQKVLTTDSSNTPGSGCSTTCDETKKHTLAAVLAPSNEASTSSSSNEVENTTVKKKSKGENKCEMSGSVTADANGSKNSTNGKKIKKRKI